MEITEEELFRKLSGYCSGAERCRAEVVEKMQRWGVPYDTIDHVADRLQQEGFIDEQRYCRAFINDKFRLEKWGKAKISQGLYLKKIAPHVYNPLLAELDSEEYMEVLRGVIRSKRKSVHAADDRELNNKLVRFAMSRGFELDDIRRCIDIPDENEVPQ